MFGHTSSTSLVGYVRLCLGHAVVWCSGCQSISLDLDRVTCSSADVKFDLSPEPIAVASKVEAKADDSKYKVREPVKPDPNDDRPLPTL